MRKDWKKSAPIAMKYAGNSSRPGPAFKPVLRGRALVVLLTAVWLLGGSGCALDRSSPGAESAPLSLSEGWLYRWGDAPLDERNIPLWTYQGLDSPEWKPAPSPLCPPGGGDANILWLRVPIPQIRWDETSLFLPRVFMSLEVYLGGERIYAHGKLEPAYTNRFSPFVPHLIRLPRDVGGEILFLRIFTHLPQMSGIQGAVLIGPGEGLIRHIIKRHIPRFLIGFFCIMVAFLSLITFLDRSIRRRYATISFGFFSFFTGVSFLSANPPLSLLIPAPQFWYYCLFLSFLFFPPALIAFVDQVIGSGYKKFIRRLWQFHLILAVVALALEAAQVFPLAMWTNYLRYLWIFDCLLLMGTCVHAALKGKYEARVFTLGIVFFSIFALFDILGGGGGELMLMPVGTFLFIFLLLYILFLRYTENSRRLRVYSQELEEKSQRLEEAKSQLEEYSRTLEHKVEERTREVREKQAQLVQSSKMAALGSLVAGVAHEINTPVGAIGSMHNTLIRAISRLRGELDESDGRADSASDRIHASFGAIDEANKVIRSGTERVIDIVRRLRSFARLDEAELKEADINEGLEDTLTIIHHQIKHNIDIIKSYGDIPKISCYPGRLNQVFLNLLINAKQAIKDKGEIAITTQAEDGKVVVKIRDTGQGIPPINLPKIFDPGYTTKGVGVGTGLGLSICYQIIQDHRGEIEVESEVGKGTTFTITLPVDLEDILDSEKKPTKVTG
jgi:signal transduction histidine kinase